MKKQIRFILALAWGFLLTAGLVSCGGTAPSSNLSQVRNFTPPTAYAANGATYSPAPSGYNVMPVTVSNFSNAYVNAPYVTVKICAPGSSTNCQTINNILLDTGSYGLRVYSGMLNSTLLSGLTKTASGSGTLTECATFADGSELWGPVAQADVYLGDLTTNEKAAGAPIQLIDSQFTSTLPSACSTPSKDPYASGFSGILGVGLFSNDCGICNVSKTNMYYSCSSSGTCATTTVSIANQVTNPVAKLPTDNNGVILMLPSVSSSAGSAPTTGYLVLGIDTQTSSPYAANSSSGMTLYQANSSGYFSVTYNSTTYTSAFIDSGSNGMYFPNTASIAICSSSSYAPGFYCPSGSQTTINATLGGSYPLSFTIYDANTLANTGNAVFNSLGAPMTGGSFDLGLPFFMSMTSSLSKKIFVGIDSKASSIGIGPYWAF